MAGKWVILSRRATVIEADKDFKKFRKGMHKTLPLRYNYKVGQWPDQIMGNSLLMNGNWVVEAYVENAPKRNT